MKGWGDSPTRLLGRWNGKCDAAVVGHDLLLDFGIMPLASMLGERFQVLKMKLEMVIGFRFKRE